MDKINFENLPSTNTPLDADTLNGMQSNIEKSVVAVGKTQPSTGENVWIKKGKNLYNKNSNFGNVLIDDNGAAMVNNVWTCSSNIKVKGNTEYTLSWTNINGQPQIEICEYKEDGTFIGNNFQTLNTGVTFYTMTLNSNTDFVKVAYRNDRQDNVQFEQGSQTTYEPYVEKEILVKNDNGVFEKFYDEFDITVEETSYQVVWNNEPYTFNFKKYGKIVTLQVLANSSDDINGIPITTIPERFRPAFELSFAALGYGALIGTAWLTTEGKLHLKTSAGNMVRIMITYVTQ